MFNFTTKIIVYLVIQKIKTCVCMFSSLNFFTNTDLLLMYFFILKEMGRSVDFQSSNRVKKIARHFNYFNII